MGLSGANTVILCAAERQRSCRRPLAPITEKVLAPIPDGPAARILDQLANVAGALEAHGLTQSHDVYGRAFQRLISDRKVPRHVLHATSAGHAAGGSRGRHDGHRLERPGTHGQAAYLRPSGMSQK